MYSLEIETESTLRETIETRNNPELEECFVKFPGRPVIPISKKRYECRVEIDQEKLKALQEEYGTKSHTHIHTHPYPKKGLIYRIFAGRTNFGKGVLHPYPSTGDVKLFLNNNEIRTMVIANTEMETGRVLEYVFIRRTQGTKYRTGSEFWIDYILDDGFFFNFIPFRRDCLKDICGRFCLKARLLDRYFRTIRSYG